MYIYIYIYVGRSEEVRLSDKAWETSMVEGGAIVCALSLHAGRALVVRAQQVCRKLALVFGKNKFVYVWEDEQAAEPEFSITRSEVQKCGKIVFPETTAAGAGPALPVDKLDNAYTRTPMLGWHPRASRAALAAEQPAGCKEPSGRYYCVRLKSTVLFFTIYRYAKIYRSLPTQHLIMLIELSSPPRAGRGRCTFQARCHTPPPGSTPHNHNHPAPRPPSFLNLVCLVPPLPPRRQVDPCLVRDERRKVVKVRLAARPVVHARVCPSQPHPVRVLHRKVVSLAIRLDARLTAVRNKFLKGAPNVVLKEDGIDGKEALHRLVWAAAWLG